MNANDLNNPLIYEHYASAIYALFVATSHIYIFHFNVNSISCIKIILEVWSKYNKYKTSSYKYRKTTLVQHTQHEDFIQQ